MQTPTHPNLYIRNEHDAHTVMEAVRLGYLPIITHRLSTHERLRYLQPGSVFVWEETEGRGVGVKGMERWTDGLKWSASRSNDPFLLYEERAEHLTVEEFRERGLDDPTASSYSYRRSNRPDKPDGLTKKTYSAFVHDPASPMSKPCKWHITSYFRRPDHKRLPTVESYPSLRSIQIIPGTFVPAKTLRRRRRSFGSREPEDQDQDQEDDESSTSPSTPYPSTFGQNGGWINSAIRSRAFSPSQFPGSYSPAPSSVTNAATYCEYCNGRAPVPPPGYTLPAVPPCECGRVSPVPQRRMILPNFSELTRGVATPPPLPRLPMPRSAGRTRWQSPGGR